ncbi:hypothetical protein [Aestuariibaculum suncheonense]|uniref:Fibronectin type-III domain-containing protein n=1 Tax=Aestuariibaculum suncheonense TaxID=1028745 RepID=A0A8J6QI34_9FLAO|nr:hypothetical protein [Aestuariibaculum suncheonense]MBD0835536.1 hypothetical protein [Aestuariibaculum suncheonense]
MKKLIYLNIALLILSCSGGDSGETNKVSSPEKTNLIFPENNSECFEGEVINNTVSKVTFEWSRTNTTDEYSVTLKNLSTNAVSTLTTSSTSLDISINRGTPYSWYVTSKSKKVTETATSDTWKFYNAGAGLIDHVPFPAEAVEPANSSQITTQSNTTTLKWSVTDLDGDITSYDVYFGETSTPALFQSNLTEVQIDDITVESGKQYYWQIKTSDAEGNTSMSDVFTFIVV